MICTYFKKIVFKISTISMYFLVKGHGLKKGKNFLSRFLLRDFYRWLYLYILQLLQVVML